MSTFPPGSLICAPADEAHPVKQTICLLQGSAVKVQLLAV